MLASDPSNAPATSSRSRRQASVRNRGQAVTKAGVRPKRRCCFHARARAGVSPGRRLQTRPDFRSPANGSVRLVTPAGGGGSAPVRPPAVPRGPCSGSTPAHRRRLRSWRRAGRAGDWPRHLLRGGCGNQRGRPRHDRDRSVARAARLVPDFRFDTSASTNLASTGLDARPSSAHFETFLDAHEMLAARSKRE